jgi:diguanylate cyclase (GGDEF)-like protein
MSGEIVVHPKMRGKYRSFISDQRTSFGEVEVTPYTESAERKAYIDRGTGVFSRNALGEILDRQLFHLREGDVNGVAVTISDLDHMKDINDTYGHVVGDEAIDCVATGVLDSVRTDENFVGDERKGDYVARYGGDEFFIISGDDIDEYGAFILVNEIPVRIRMTADKAKKSAGYDVYSTSGGAFTDKYMHMKEFMERADEAMYCVKHTKGRKSALWVPENKMRVYKWGEDGYLYDDNGKRMEDRDGKHIHKKAMEI